MRGRTQTIKFIEFLLGLSYARCTCLIPFLQFGNPESSEKHTFYINLAMKSDLKLCKTIYSVCLSHLHSTAEIWLWIWGAVLDPPAELVNITQSKHHAVFLKGKLIWIPKHIWFQVFQIMTFGPVVFLKEKIPPINHGSEGKLNHCEYKGRREWLKSLNLTQLCVLLGKQRSARWS